MSNVNYGKSEKSQVDPIEKSGVKSLMNLLTIFKYSSVKNSIETQKLA